LKLTPDMAYANSIMAWSAFFFGPAISFCHLAPLRFSLDYGRWYCIPNFGWGLEWGLQLLGDSSGSGLRAFAIMALSISSYALTFALADQETGFNVAFLPQVVGAIVMCVVCFRRFRSAAAGKALAIWVSACILFLLQEAVMAAHVGPGKALEGFEAPLTITTQICDCTQIHFSIRFFVCMYRSKHAREAAAAGATILPDVVATPQTSAEVMKTETHAKKLLDRAAAATGESAAGSFWH